MPFAYTSMRFLRVLVVSVLFTSTAAGEQPEIIVVTASRTPVPESLVGSSLTIIDQSELSRRQAISLADLLRDVPGLAVSRSGVMGSTTQIRVRGAEANQVLVLIDGVEANDLTQGSEFNFAHLAAADIERVEVMRGPQSALWGSDALAGVINVITRSRAQGLAASGYLEGGSFGTVHGGGSIAGGNDHYHFHAGGSRIDSDGSNISSTGSEDDGYENSTLYFSAGVQPLENFSFSASGRHVDATNQFDTIDFVVTGLPVDGDLETDVAQDYARAEARLALLDGRWEQVLSGNFTSTENDNFNGGVETESTQGRKYGLDYQTSVFLSTTGSFPADHTFTFAVDYEEEDFTQRGTATPFGDPNQDLGTDALGLVGEYRLGVGRSFSLSISGRRDDNSDFNDDTSYRVTGAWSYAATGTRLRAAYGTGSKNPSFTERFGFFSSDSQSFFVGNPELAPERSRGWDIGIEQSLLNSDLELGLGYFREHLKNEINGFVFDPALGPFGAFTARNVDGTSRRRGVEFTAGWSLPFDLRLKGFYVYLDATEPDAAGVQIEEVRRPRHTGGVNLNYTFADGRGNLNLNIFYNGEQEDLFFPPFPQPITRVSLDEYVLVSLAAEYRVLENLALFGRVENLTDERYEEVLGFRSPGLGAYGGVRVSLKP